MPKPRIFFLHNPKAGGSSLRSIFSRLVGEGSVAPMFSNAPNEHRESAAKFARHRGYHLYAGHYGYAAYKLLSKGHHLVTNFRDPVERVHSIYRYWRNNIRLELLNEANPRDVAVVALAHSLTFSRFIRSANPDLQLYINNFHFRQLYHSGWERPVLDWRARWLVKRRIAAMPWFYIAETPEASARLLHRCFPDAPDFTIPRDNRSAGSSQALDPADVEHLKLLNALDYEIYAVALRLQTERLARSADFVPSEAVNLD